MRSTIGTLVSLLAFLAATPICLAQGTCNCTDLDSTAGYATGGCEACGDCGGGDCGGGDCGGGDCGCSGTARFRRRGGALRVPTLSEVCGSVARSCNGGVRRCRGLLAGGLSLSNVPTNPDCRAQAYAWHRGYAHTEFGRPVALVVPPTSHLQTNWSWGTGSSRISRIDHQFNRYPPGGGGFGGGGFRTTPAWPSDTTQFGVYPVRALW